MGASRSPGRVRDATVEDLDFIVHANLSMARETENKMLSPEILRRGVSAVLSDPRRGSYLVAEVETASGVAPVGCLLITQEWSDWRNAYFWWIQSVYVERDQRGRGIYSALHREVENRGRARGDVCGIRLYVERDNEIAQKVYRSLGMTRSDYHLMEQCL